MIPMAKNRHKKNKELDDQVLESASGGIDLGVTINKDGMVVNGQRISGPQKPMNEPPISSADFHKFNLG